MSPLNPTMVRTSPSRPRHGVVNMSYWVTVRTVQTIPATFLCGVQPDRRNRLSRGHGCAHQQLSALVRFTV